MTRQLVRTYRRVRAAGVACIVGGNAEISLKIARTILQFDALESAGLVRITQEHDAEPDLSYLDTWEHLSAQSKQRYIDSAYQLGIMIVRGEFRISEDAEWQHGDSICGNVGYQNAASPYENAYVPDIMAQTIASLADALRGRFCPRCGKRVA